MYSRNYTVRIRYYNNFWRPLGSLRVAEYNTDYVIYFLLVSCPFSAVTVSVARQECHPACKKSWVCWRWRFERIRFARLIATVLSPPTFVILSSNKIQIGGIPGTGLSGCPGKCLSDESGCSVPVIIQLSMYFAFVQYLWKKCKFWRRR